MQLPYALFGATVMLFLYRCS